MKNILLDLTKVMSNGEYPFNKMQLKDKTYNFNIKDTENDYIFEVFDKEILIAKTVLPKLKISEWDIKNEEDSIYYILARIKITLYRQCLNGEHKMSEPIKEGKFVKGGHNTKPTTPRPPAPKAQIPSPMEANKMSDVILSDKEQTLYNAIKNSEFDVTVKNIETHLGKEYIGALGKLLQLGKIKSEKRNLEVATGKDLNPYGYKWVKCYFVEKEEK